LLIGNSDDSAIHQFIREYNAWYSEALPLIRNLLSDRLTEFESFYRNVTPTRGDTSLSSIEDYIVMASHWASFSNNMAPFDTACIVTRSKFRSQISMVESVGIRVDSILADVKRVLQADLFDSELDVARELKRNVHLRASGVVAGVVLENHLKKIYLDHGLNVGRSPTISNLNDLLKNDGIIDVPEWRRI
jgi:hypothetical protein